MKSVVSSRRSKEVVRAATQVSVYLVLYSQDNILFSLRQNTGYCDGCYGLVSGHVEQNESAYAAMIREAREEAGVIIQERDLRLAHVLHRKTGRLNIDLFFTCHRFEGEVVNCEPDKCGALSFFEDQNDPTPTVDYVLEALDAIKRGELYAEKGWE